MRVLKYLPVGLWVDNAGFHPLSSLLSNVSISFESLQEGISRPDQIGEAIDYIKNLQIKLEKMKEKKHNLTDIVRSRTATMNMELKSPQFKIQQMGSVLEVVLVSGLDFHFIFNETIRVLQEEGSDIVNASYTVAENAVLHKIHCQVSFEFSITLLPYQSINSCVSIISQWIRILVNLLTICLILYKKKKIVFSKLSLITLKIELKFKLFNLKSIFERILTFRIS